MTPALAFVLIVVLSWATWYLIAEWRRNVRDGRDR